MAIGQSVNKDLKHVDSKSRCSGNVSGSERGSSVKSNVTYHKCDKKGHIQKDCKSKGTDSNGKPTKKSTNNIPEWITKKHVVSDTKDLVTSTTTRKKRSTNGAPHVIMVVLHGDFNGSMAAKHTTYGSRYSQYIGEVNPVSRSAR